MKTLSEEKTLNLLLSGKHPKAKKFAGHHVLVINDQVFPLKEKEAGLKDIERLSYAEIAHTLNISVSTVRTNLEKAREFLRATLKDFL